MALSDDLVSAQIGHQIGLHRLATGLVRRIVGLLNATDADLVRQLSESDPSSWSTRRVNQILSAIREINAEAYVLIQKTLSSELQDLAEYEAQYQLALLDHTVPVKLDWASPTVPQLRAVALSRPFQGGLLREWVAGMEAGRAKRLREVVRISVAEGETTAQIVRRVRGTAPANYRDGVLEISRRSAETIVRTAVNHTAQATRAVLYEANSDLISGEEWVSTLDLRTTPICRARDGKVFPLGRGPRPPAHLRCRSCTSPVVKSWHELGIDLEEAPRGTRASMNGQVSGDLTYSEWMRRQPIADQEEVLGVAKARLFRNGGLSLDKFVEMRSGREYTLTELRSRESAAFSAAGLDA